MPKQIQSNPIIEAVCEIQFVFDKELDFTVPGLMYDQVRKEFPIKKQQVGIGFSFKPTKKGFEHKIEQALPRTQFHKKDGTALIQVAPDLLVINKLKPYTNWKNFSSLILDNYNKFTEISKPTGINRIALKYINSINFKKLSKEEIQLEDYFCYYPHMPEKLPSIDNFVTRVEIPYANGQDKLLLTISSSPPEQSIILDLDYIMIIPKGINISKVKDWIESSHDKIKEAFESCITDKCRKILG